MRTLRLGILLGASVLPAQSQSLAAKLKASRLASQVEIALARDEALRAFTFDAEVREGALMLTGQVETAAQRERAAELAQSVEGVTSVSNRVTVGRGAVADLSELPPAPEDTAATADSEAVPAEEPAPEPEKVYHTVRRGDVLGAIARRYGVSVRQVQQLNGLRGTNIRIGQRLRVK